MLCPGAQAARCLPLGIWLLVWGITVSGDSPQFSALTASNAPPQAVGSVLTLTNCIDFAVCVISIELFLPLSKHWPLASLLPRLGPGPLRGLWALRPLLRERQGAQRKHVIIQSTDS